MSHQLSAHCTRRFPPGDERQMKEPYSVTARLSVDGDNVTGELTLVTSDPMLRDYLQQGKHYHLTLALAPLPAAPESAD